jgi:hypothetical protein
MAGRVEDNARFLAGASDYGVRFDTPASMRQRGNTLFIVNAPADAAATTYWGLASDFRILDVNASVDLAAFDPVRIVFTANYVKNLAFDRNRMEERSGQRISDGSGTGFLGRLLVGQPAMHNAGDWNASFTYRWLGSDAVLDAFTNSDFGLGGTNNKGLILGASYGVDKNTWLTVRWMSSKPIDSYAPRLATGVPATPTRLAADLLQIDLNAKF